MGLTIDKVVQSAAESNIAISDGVDTLAVNGDGSLNSVVTATNLDIRDLVFATDSVNISGSTLGANDGVDIGDVTINNASGVSAVNIQDGGNSITVDAVDLDIRNLTHVASQDSVRIGDGTDLLEINADGSLNFQTAATTTMNTVAVTATTTVQQLPATNLANRRFINIQNRNDEDIFMVEAIGSVKADGTYIPKNASLFFEAGPSLDIFLVSDATTADVRILEIA